MNAEIAPRTEFVGRAAERALLRGVLKEALAGRGCLVSITGEAGVGKSRLAEESAAEAEDLGFRTLIGRCHEMDATVPYAPLVDLLARAARSEDAGSLRRALGEEEVPGSVRLVIGRQLDRISDDARSMLSCAAVAGRSLSIDLLRAIREEEGDPTAAIAES